MLRVADLDSALSRAAACRPVYGVDDDVLLVNRDPFAGKVTVSYVPSAAPRVTYSVAEAQYRVRGHRGR